MKRTKMIRLGCVYSLLFGLMFTLVSPVPTPKKAQADERKEETEKVGALTLPAVYEARYVDTSSLSEENELIFAKKESRLQTREILSGNVPNEESGCKSYKKTHMGYKAITCKSSSQYQLQQEAVTNKENGIRMAEGCYMVAVGTYYADQIGQHILVYMENGEVIECIVGDFKADEHTDKTNRYHTGGYDNGIYYEGDGSVLEFIVDTSIYTAGEYPEELKGNIFHIEKIEG